VAEEVLKATEGNVARREHLGLVDDSKASFRDFVDSPAKDGKAWWPTCSPKFRPKTRDRWRNILDKHLLPFFGGSLRGIRGADAAHYISQRLKDGAAHETVRQELTVLGHILRRAVEWELLGKNLLLDGQGRLLGDLRIKTTPGRIRFLSEAETAALLEACKARPLLHESVLLALNTGCRRNELLSATRRTVDFERRTLTLQETKNGERRVVPLNETALGALKAALKQSAKPLDKDAPLFPFKPLWLSVFFRRVAKRPGVEDFHLHDLRHCFATSHAQAGTAMRGLQALLGHRTAAMTQRYAHFADDALRAAVDAVQVGGAKTGND